MQKTERVLNVMFNKPSPAGKIPSPRMTIPKQWLEAMGVNPEERSVVAIFDGEKIIIKKAE